MQSQTVKPSSEILARINKDSLNHKVKMIQESRCVR